MPETRLNAAARAVNQHAVAAVVERLVDPLPAEDGHVDVVHAARGRVHC